MASWHPKGTDPRIGYFVDGNYCGTFRGTLNTCMRCARENVMLTVIFDNDIEHPTANQAKVKLICIRCLNAPRGEIINTQIQIQNSPERPQGQ